HIAAAVKREVWVRDRGCCTFVGASGRRCSARGALEFHHRHPYAAGGEATVENIALRCAAHNRYEADVFYRPIRAGIAAVNGRGAMCRAVPERDLSQVMST